MTHLAQKQHSKVRCFCAKWVISKKRHNQFWLGQLLSTIQKRHWTCYIQIAIDDLFNFICRPIHFLGQEKKKSLSHKHGRIRMWSQTLGCTRRQKIIWVPPLMLDMTKTFWPWKSYIKKKYVNYINTIVIFTLISNLKTRNVIVNGWVFCIIGLHVFICRPIERPVIFRWGQHRIKE